MLRGALRQNNFPLSTITYKNTDKTADSASFSFHKHRQYIQQG